MFIEQNQTMKYNIYIGEACNRMIEADLQITINIVKLDLFHPGPRAIHPINLISCHNLSLKVF